MKRILFACLVALSVVMLSSCKSEDKTSPEYVTKTFVNAYFTGDFNTLYKCTPKNNHAIIEQMQRAMNKNKAQYEKVKKNKVEIIEVKPVFEEDSLAEYECRFMFNDKERTSTCDLCVEEGKWVVDLTLQSAMRSKSPNVTLSSGAQVVVK